MLSSACEQQTETILQVMLSDMSYSCKHLPFMLIDKLTDMNNLYEAFQKCKRNVYWKASVQKYEEKLYLNLLRLRQSILDRTYKQKPYLEFDTIERGKRRHIRALHISDRVLQRTLCDYVLIPEINKYLIYDNGASRKDMGISFTRKRTVQMLSEFLRRRNDGYVLKIDFSKYFDSIPHKELYTYLTSHLSDDSVNWLIWYLIDFFPGSRGLGLGAQFSQVAGSLYLTPVDNWCKIVKGVRCYIRYNDDILILHSSKEYLNELQQGITQEATRIGLQLNKDKTFIAPLRRGLVFLKIRYVLKRNRIIRIPDKNIFIRERKKLRVLDIDILKQQYRSWRGNVRKFHCRRKLMNLDRAFKERIYD